MQQATPRYGLKNSQSVHIGDRVIVMGPKKKFLQGALVMPVAKKFGTTASEIIEVVNKGNFEVYVVDFGKGREEFLASQLKIVESQEEAKIDEEKKESDYEDAAAEVGGIASVVTHHAGQQYVEVLDELDAEMNSIPPVP